MDFELSYLLKQMPALWRGLLVTLEVSAVSLVLAVLAGILGAAIRHMKVPVLSQLTACYVEFIRNTPLLVQMFLVVFGLPAIGLRLPLFWAGVVSLAAWAAAFHVESIRGGLASVKRELYEAGSSLGLKPWQLLWLVALPLGLRVALPSMLNTSVSLVKNSAMLQAVGLMELTFVAVDRMAMDFRILEMFTVMLVVYVALVFLLSFASNRLEAYLKRPFRP